MRQIGWRGPSVTYCRVFHAFNMGTMLDNRIALTEVATVDSRPQAFQWIHEVGVWNALSAPYGPGRIKVGPDDGSCAILELNPAKTSVTAITVQYFATW